jgi:antitoxin (DNA-binding transcriptional repressor) of toxin-antitoxin stability system
MEFVPYRLLRNQPKELRRKLEEKGELVVTVNGEPMAIMLPVPKGSLEDMVMLLSQVRAQLAVAAMREDARQKGLDHLTPDEIDEVVEDVRRERRSRGQAT